LTHSTPPKFFAITAARSTPSGRISATTAASR
jgi:hypothetical protein